MVKYCIDFRTIIETRRNCVMDVTYNIVDEYKRRVSQAEKEYQYRAFEQPSRLSLAFKNLLTLVARF